MGDKVLEGTRVETLGGIVECVIIYIIDCRRELVACDGADNDVGIPCLAVGKVGGLSCFSCGCGSRWIEQYSGGMAAGMVNAAPLRWR